MAFTKNFFKMFLAAIFSLALLLPTAVQFAHTFEGHEHKACTDISTHLHEKRLDCSICDFHFSLFNFTPQQQPEFVIQEGFQKTEILYLLPELESTTTHYYLRGPPRFS